MAWTVQAIWKNLGGGIQPGEPNARLLSCVGAALYAEHRYWEAADALEASLALHDDPKVEDAMWELRDVAEREARPMVRTNPGLDPVGARIAFFLIVTSFIALVVIGVVTLGRSSGDNSSAPIVAPGFNLHPTSQVVKPAVAPTVTNDLTTIAEIDLATVRAQGYTPYTSAVADAGTGHILVAIVGICNGSATGRCQIVHFFIDSTYLGTDTKGVSQGISALAAGASRQMDVTYVNYAPTDPGCCPSRLPVTITYTWDGNRLTASGTPPGH
jgi:hypothetical protein